MGTRMRPRTVMLSAALVLSARRAGRTGDARGLAPPRPHGSPTRRPARIHALAAEVRGRPSAVRDDLAERRRRPRHGEDQLHAHRAGDRPPEDRPHTQPPRGHLREDRDLRAGAARVQLEPRPDDRPAHLSHAPRRQGRRRKPAHLRGGKRRDRPSAVGTRDPRARRRGRVHARKLRAGRDGHARGRDRRERAVAPDLPRRAGGRADVQRHVDERRAHNGSGQRRLVEPRPAGHGPGADRAVGLRRSTSRSSPTRTGGSASPHSCSARHSSGSRGSR